MSLQPVPPAGENTPVTLTGGISDPGWLDPLTATVDWGDGAGPQALAGTLENVRPDATLSFAVAHTYGDDGTFTIEVCGSDDATSTCRSADAAITNTDPTAAISADGQTPYNGQKAFIAHMRRAGRREGHVDRPRKRRPEPDVAVGGRGLGQPGLAGEPMRPPTRTRAPRSSRAT